jgi:hypothetical protein
MRFLLSFVIRVILLAVFTFGFVVLFEHGPARFSEGAKAEWNALLFFVGSVLSREESALPRPRVQASPTPASSPISTSAPTQKAPPAEPATNRPATATPAANR